LLGEKAQALSSTPAVFESRLGRRLISNQVLDVFVILVRSLLPGALVKPPARETLLQGNPSLLARSSPLAAAAAGPWGALRGGKALRGHFCCWHRDGRAEPMGCCWLPCCREGRRGRGALCAPQSGSQVLVPVPAER